MRCFKPSSVSRRISWLATPVAAIFTLGLVAGCQQGNDMPSQQDTPKSPDIKSKDTGGPATPTKGSGVSSTDTPATPVAPSDTSMKNPDRISKDMTAHSSPTPAASGGPTASSMAMMGPDFKDPKRMATHTLKADSPYFKSMPSASAKPEGWWKAGTPVLLTTPESPYSKVEAGDGSEAYVATANLEPKSNK